MTDSFREVGKRHLVDLFLALDDDEDPLFACMGSGNEIHLPLFYSREALQAFWAGLGAAIHKTVQVDDPDRMLVEVPSVSDEGRPVHIVLDPRRLPEGGWIYHRVLRD